MRALVADIEAIEDVEVFGRVRAVQGLLVEVVGPVRELRVGGRVSIDTVGGETLAAEIIGFREGHALCLPFGPLSGVRLGCRAVFRANDGAVYPAQSWLGRVINANAEPVDGKPLFTDGPYVEGNEHVGGLTIIAAPDLDAALEWARKGALAATLPIEVRPLAQ